MPEEPPSSPDWNRISEDPQFQALLKRKARFLVPWTIFFLLYYVALPISVGWFPEVMKTQVLGKLNIAYLFALSQFFMAWILAAIYVREAAVWDREAERLKSTN